MRSLSFIFALFCCTFSVRGQYFVNENKVWIFGNHARVDFTSGAPVAGGMSPANVFEGGACVSNSAGELLFYTDGDTVFNRLGVPMPSATNISPYFTWSTSQSALIVPFLNDTNKYYIFSLEQQVGTAPDYCHLSYSVIDLTLDGGLGDAPSGSTPIILNDKMGEKLIAVPGNSCNIWVIAHKKDTSLFYVYEVTSAGVAAPATYDVGSVVPAVGPSIDFGPFCNGVMKCSPDRTKIVMVTFRTGVASGGSAELFDFDPASGVVSNCRVISSAGAYGAEFSPDNSKLYLTSTTDSSSIYQYDISLLSLASIQASRIKVSTGIIAGDLKLAPDGKIYFAGSGYSGHSLGCITYPDSAGISCGFNPGALDLTPYFPQMGMPNLFWRSPMPSLSGAITLCVGDIDMYAATIPAGTWTSSNSSILSINAVTGIGTALSAGIDTLVYSAPGGCDNRLIVTVNVSPSLLGDVIPLCVGETRTMSNTVPGGVWSSAAIDVATINGVTGTCTGVTAGTTSITYAIGGCYATTILNVVDCPAGIPGPASDDGIAIYPIPAAGQLHIVLPDSHTGGAILKMYDMAGVLVIRKALENRESSLSVVSLPAGVFQCIITDEADILLMRKLVTKL